MYVKWVVRKHKNEELANISFYDAYLVQSYKNSAGEPRQRTIAYLGNLRQINGEFPVIERALFYVRMEDTLSRTLTPEIMNEDERTKLYSGLSAVAPPPTEEEILVGTEIHRIWHSGYWKARALNPADIAAGFANYEMETQYLTDGSEQEPAASVSLDGSKIVGRLNPPQRQGKETI